MLNVLAAHKTTYFLINLYYESDDCVIRQAVVVVWEQGY